MVFAFLRNPDRFMAVSRWLAPTIGLIAAALLLPGIWLTFSVPQAERFGDTVRILFIHVPFGILSMFAYACLAGASFLSLIFRHVLADMAAKAAAPLGAGFTALCLLTGSFWGRPAWGVWWEWDGRMTSELVLLLLYLSYMVLRGALDDEQKAARAAAVLALVGVINLPIIHFSVYWWSSLHQGSTLANIKVNLGGPYVAPVFLMLLGMMALFGALWLVRIRAEVWRRKASSLAMRAAQ